MDETCSYKAPEGTYEKFNYGRMLPYSSNSIVGQDCISCLEVDNDNNNNQNNQNYNYNNNGNNQNNQNNQNQNWNEEQNVNELW